MLKHVQVPQGREEYYREALEGKVKEAVRSSGGKGKLWETLVKELGSRSDTVYNLASHAGMESYLHTESYYRSGMSPADLSQYVTRIQGNSVGEKRKGKAPAPVYVRDTVPSSTIGGAASSEGWSRSMPRTGGTVILGRMGDEKKPENLSGEHSDANVIPFVIPSAADTKKVPKSDSQPSDPETMRLRRIEAEYEKEKAEWEKKRQPVLARSATHDLGGAESVERNKASSTIMVNEIFNMVKTIISDVFLG